MNVSDRSRERDHRGVAGLRATDTTQDTQRDGGLSQKPNWDHENQSPRPDTDSQLLHDQALPMGCQDTGTKRKDGATEVGAAEFTLNQRSSHEGAEEEEEQLRTDPGQVTGSSGQSHRHVQVSPPGFHH